MISDEIRCMIRENVKDKLFADCILASLKDEDLREGIIKINQTMLNINLKERIISLINNEYVQDYKIRFDNDRVYLTLYGAIRLGFITHGFSIAYTVSVLDFRFDSEAGHSLFGGYKESSDGIPKLLYAGYDTVLCRLTHNKAGISATSSTVSIDFDRMPQLTSFLRNSCSFGDNLALTYESISNGDLCLKIETR